MEKSSLSSILIAAMLLAVAVIAEAQQPKKVSRIGYLSNADAATDSARAEGIRLALRELGYIEGQNIAIEYRYAEGKADRAPELAAELVRLKVDIIVVASGDQWIRAAKNATKTIPIVMMGQGTDPVRAGHVKSLARPGGTSYSNVGFKALRDFVAAMLGDVVGAPRIPRQHALDIQSDSIARLMIPIRILSS